MEESDIHGPPVTRVSANPPEDHGGDQPAQEQPCDAPEDGGADAAAVAAISLSKTPIMRMKTKSEPKRIAVSLKSTDEAVEGIGMGGNGEPGTELEPIEAPLGQMTPMEMLLQDSMKLGGGMLVNLGSEQQKKSSAFHPTVLPAGLAQVRNLSAILRGDFLLLQICILSDWVIKGQHCFCKKLICFFNKCCLELNYYYIVK